MSSISDFNLASNADTDREHEVQLGLLQDLCDAVRDQQDAAVVAQILEQLTAYTEAHFISEELLMRLKSYDDFEDHVEDHAHMLEVLRSIAADHAVGLSSLVAGQAQAALSFITQHIATRDQRFAAFVRSGQ